MRSTALILALLFVVGFGYPVQAAERHAGKAKLEPALQYDFVIGQGPKISDASGKKHNGLLKNGEIVFGHIKNAVKLDGNGMISIAPLPATLDPALRSLTVGAFCQPASPDGVIVAMGDKTNGFSLYLKEGVPHFVVRANGELFKVAAPEPVIMEQWVHLAGTIDAQGKMSLIVDGWPVAASQGKLIPQKPSGGFSIGADSSSAVGEYTSPLCWHGLLQDARLYWGVADRTEDRDLWGDWANLPGCGCKK
jgi:hypothetical protein